MDIRWKKYSYSLTAKIIAFIIVLLSYTALITILVNILAFHGNSLDIAFKDSYYLSADYMRDSSAVISNLREAARYKSEQNILNGGTISENDVANEENRLFADFQDHSRNYNPQLTREENYKIFREVYADRIAKIKEQLIERDLKDYRPIIKELEKYQGVIYYVQNGDSKLTNSPDLAKDYFKSFPAYMVLDSSEQSIFPAETKNAYQYLFTSIAAQMEESPDVICIAFTDGFLKPRLAMWQENKTLVTRSLYQLAGLSLALLLAFIYLVLVAGRKPQEDPGIHLTPVDRIYNDINLGLCAGLIALWFAIMIQGLFRSMGLTFAVTLVIAALGLTLVLSLVKHFKNKTLIKHSLTYVVLSKLFAFGKDVYNHRDTAVKAVLIVVGYPIVAGLTFFMFPVTIGVAAWLALKEVKKFKAIKEGVQRVKKGDIHCTIDVPGDGELARLASDINSITDGLNKAVENGIKSERLKSELITNVSHDIRTPLTSIITYVDLLKKEKDPVKIEEYIAVVDQKAERLKVLTEDLFEAAKASSGDIPVNYENIEMISLLTQGLGELDDKIRERRLEFKLNVKDKVYVRADGKLLWRAVENLLSNILKYALEGSRIYIDITDLGQRVEVVLKNISAYELNISSDELMERFKRGDESRSSGGSGLGLSIAQSLIEIQQGSFHIEIDGDLFKAVIQINKA